MKVFKLEVDGGEVTRFMGVFSSMAKTKAAAFDDFCAVIDNGNIELREATKDERGGFDAIYFPAFKDAPSDLSMMDAMEEYMFLQYLVTECELDEVIK